MIRATRPADVVRYGVFGGPVPGNRAYPLSAVGTDPTVVMSKRDVMATVASLRSKDTCSLTLSHDRYVPAIIAAQPRSNPRCWDVTHLLVDSPDGAACARRVRHPVSRGIAARRRANISPHPGRRPTRPTRVVVRVHEVWRRDPVDRTESQVPPRVYTGHPPREADRRARPVPTLQRLDAFPRSSFLGNDRRPVACSEGTSGLAKP